MTDLRDPIARLKDRIKDSGWGVAVDETLSFTHAELSSLYGLWRAKAEAMGALPSREDFDIRMLKPFLRHIAILERVPDAGGKSQYRIRLQGTTMAHYFGDQQGKMLERAVPSDLVERWTTIYDALLEARRPLRLRGSYEAENMNYLTTESFAVPLGNGAALPVRVLSATYFMSRIQGGD
jgi:hypothetical protein